MGNEENTDNRDIIYCTECGAENSASNNFCCNCGCSMKDTAPGSDERDMTDRDDQHKTVSGSYGAPVTDPDAADYIKKKPDYYIAKFNEIKNLRKICAWNWPAFFFSGLWMIYRKMYIAGAVTLLLTFAASCTGIFGCVISLAIAVASGLLGTYIYMFHIERVILRGRSVDPEYTGLYKSRSGGVNRVLPVILAIVYALLFLAVIASTPLFFGALHTALFDRFFTI